MKVFLMWTSLFIGLGITISGFTSPKDEYDVVVYGGSSAGIIAGYTAKQLGKSVLVIEPSKHIGGLTTGGLGATDIGNKYAVTGIAKDYYRRIGAYYNKFEQWTFEPHVAQKVYNDYIKAADLIIIKSYRLKTTKVQNGRIQEIVVENSDKPSKKTNRTIRAKMFIDATYEGDLMAQSGVSYTVGREGKEVYNETYNGVQMSHFHQVPDGVDPYKIPGNPKSGLIWGVTDGKLAPIASGDNKVQAYNFRLCLTQDKSNQIAFSKPDNYSPQQFELLRRILEKENWKSVSSSFVRDTLADGRIVIHHNGGFLIKAMPNGKTDANNFGGFSTDMIGANHDYPDGNYKNRARIWKEHEDYTKGLLYFLANDPSVPQNVREDMSSWGFTRDEFIEYGGFSPQLYVREARRMVGDVVMTQAHCQGKEVVTDGVGMAAYGMDSHNIQRIIVNGMVKNEGDIQVWLGIPYPISYRSIVPKKTEIQNLLVPICMSASHIAFGSIRMEPVFMVLAQSAATAAVMAIDDNKSVQSIDVSELQKRLRENPLADGSTPEILIDNEEGESIEINGKWAKHPRGYGKSSLSITATPASTDYVKFTPTIQENGEYDVYVYFSNFDTLPETISVMVNIEGTKKLVTIQSATVKQLGLPSGDWVSIGTYKFQKGKRSSVQILGKGTSKSVVADAIIFRRTK